jgi:hypothetical protein
VVRLQLQPARAPLPHHLHDRAQFPAPFCQRVAASDPTPRSDSRTTTS